MSKYDGGDKIHVEVRAIIRHENNKILLVKHPSKSNRYSNKWELPGGKISSEDCLEKDLRGILQSKVGLVVKVETGICFCQKRKISSVGKYQDSICIEIAIPCVFVGGEVVLNDDVSDFAWVEYSKVFSYDLTTESKDSVAQFLLTKVEDDPLKLPVILAARALIKDKLGKYLFLKRVESHAYQNKWDLPGGKLSSLEVLPELLKREVFEETGLVVDVIIPSLYVHSQIGIEGKHKGYTYINILNEARIRSGKVRLSLEHNAYNWFSVDEIFKLELAPYLPIPLTEIFLKGKS